MIEFFTPGDAADLARHIRRMSCDPARRAESMRGVDHQRNPEQLVEHRVTVLEEAVLPEHVLCFDRERLDLARVQCPAEYARRDHMHAVDLSGETSVAQILQKSHDLAAGYSGDWAIAKNWDSVKLKHLLHGPDGTPALRLAVLGPALDGAGKGEDVASVLWLLWLE